MKTDTSQLQENTAIRTDAAVTGPHPGYDKDGRLDHRYWRCERCGLESTDPQLARGCWECEPETIRGGDPDRDAG